MLSDTGLLAARAQPGTLFRDLLPWLLVLVTIAIVGSVVIFVARRMLKDETSDMPAEGFTLHQLRQLHTSGSLDDAEFERAKALLIGRLADSSSEDASGSESDVARPGNQPNDPVPPAGDHLAEPPDSSRA